MGSYSREPMMDVYITETLQMLESLEQLALAAEANGISGSINEIFRIMHSIKGSSAMMLLNNIATLTHAVEDLFDFLRSEKPEVSAKKIADMLLDTVDFIKNEISKIQEDNEPNGDAGNIIANVKKYLGELSGQAESTENHESETDNKDQKYYISSIRTEETADSKTYKAILYFEDGAGMENVRAFTAVQALKDISQEIHYSPDKLLEDEGSIETIISDGFVVTFNSNAAIDAINEAFVNVALIKDLNITEVEKTEMDIINKKKKPQIVLDETEAENEIKEEQKEVREERIASSVKQSVISVNISKLDTLMDLVGELVISEAMVTQNPELSGLNLNNFYKAARQLKKITNEIQDNVMSIRMVPLAMTFQKMNRIVRDMAHKLNKDICLEIIGENTEVDKNIIENVSDPIMHLIRNSIDHGLESKEERMKKGKNEKGKVTLEAKNSGGDVWITVKDDGRGLDKEKILKKAKEKGILVKPEVEYTDKEIFSFILAPGFSTSENITEYSGRGVGMDVVCKNIEKVRGSIFIDSTVDVGTTIVIKIPLTLAIIDGMNIKVGNSRYTIPITSIKESFRTKEESIIKDTDDAEMILLRGECYPVIRLHEVFNVETRIKTADEGIIIMIEDDERIVSLFADKLLGEQQVVVKALPKYINQVKGVAGCTLLGDGSISLILDTASLVKI